MPRRKIATILGIDPGLATTGFGVITHGHGTILAKAYGTINTPAGDPLPRRLATIYRHARQLIRKWQPDIFALEELFYHRNATTAFSVGQARGVIMLAAAQAHLPVVSCKPLQVKRAVAGYGRATKSQLQRAVAQLLHLTTVPRPDDAADALAVALCGQRLVRSHQATQRPQNAQRSRR